MIVRAREVDRDIPLRLDLSSSGAEVSKFPQPAKSTTLAGYHRGRKLAVFTAPRDPDGAFLWTSADGSADFVQRIALNLQLAGIAGLDGTAAAR